MRLDLSDLDLWTDLHVVEALDEHEGLSESDRRWAGILYDQYQKWRYLTVRQRALAEKILRESNGG